MKKIKEKVASMSANRFSCYFCYMLIFINFMGVDFLKFKIAGINMNVGRILMILAIIPLIIYIKKIGLKQMIKEKYKVVSHIIIFLIIWVIFSLFTSILSKDIYNTIINEFFMIFGTISILVLTNELKSIKSIINVLKIIEITMVINSIYSLFLYYSNVSVYGGFYYNVNDLATFFVLGIPIEMVLIFFENNKSKINYIRYVILVLEIYVFSLLQSRACVLGCLIGIISTSLIYIYKKSERIKEIIKKKKTIICIIVFLTILICMLRNNCNKIF